MSVRWLFDGRTCIGAICALVIVTAVQFAYSRSDEDIFDRVRPTYERIKQEIEDGRRVLPAKIADRPGERESS